ncbi:MAG TPA: DUF488 domain-containing protein [Solirubrobacteraceae bacterium]|nr:DUF488 domain-containing protein [Solirubrobacteraceae bacterium]
MPTIATIGVYDFDGASFVATLDRAGVTQVLDVRQRRGVRGSQYAWANAQRLQTRLAAAGIGYVHHPELAPDTAMRDLQYAEDGRRGEGKRTRSRLSQAYVTEYTREVLDLVSLDPLVAGLPVHGIAALMCVEATAPACHRSLIAARLADRYGFAVVDLEPEEATGIDLG